MEPATLVGYVAATLTTAAFVPQVLHTWRTRSVDGISAGMYTVFTGGVVLWLVYGVLIREWPIIAANGLTLVMALSILLMKLRYRQRRV
jgi:MtN3 and saliva related transmembrane protein